MDDRLLTIKDLAAYLRMNERTILKMAQEGKIPGMKIASQWRFRQDMIDAWLERGMTVEESEAAGPSPAEPFDLASCIREEYVLSYLQSTTKLEAIQEIAAFALSVGVVRDATWFAGALLERENMLSTAVEGGAAMLHTRHCSRRHTVRPFLLITRSREGIEWGALDNAPTDLFFVLGLKYDTYHLRALAQLSTMLRSPGFLERLRRSESAAAIHAEVLAGHRAFLEES